MSDFNQLTPDQLQRLNQLNDIDLPKIIHWWPLAWGWWILIAIIISTIIGGLLAVYLRKKYLRSVKRQALAELDQIEQLKNYDKELAYKLSVLLKRIILTQLNKRKIIAKKGSISQKKEVTLSGEQWADFLVKEGGLSQQTADFIAHAPYRLNYANSPNRQSVMTEIRQWINKTAK